MESANYATGFLFLIYYILYIGRAGKEETKARNSRFLLIILIGKNDRKKRLYGPENEPVVFSWSRRNPLQAFFSKSSPKVNSILQWFHTFL